MRGGETQAEQPRCQCVCLHANHCWLGLAIALATGDTGPRAVDAGAMVNCWQTL